MTIVGPDTRDGAEERPAADDASAQPGTFTLNVHNTGTGRAWDLTLTDRLPNTPTSGMCDTAPAGFHGADVSSGRHDRRWTGAGRRHGLLGDVHAGARIACCTSRC